LQHSPGEEGQADGGAGFGIGGIGRQANDRVLPIIHL
jgi:hypothetical protein